MNWIRILGLIASVMCVCIYLLAFMTDTKISAFGAVMGWASVTLMHVGDLLRGR